MLATTDSKNQAVSKLESLIERGRSRAATVINHVMSNPPTDRLVRGDGLQFRAADNLPEILITVPNREQGKVDRTLHRNAIYQMAPTSDMPVKFLDSLRAVAEPWGRELLAQRKLAREMPDNDLLDSAAAGTIQRTQGVKHQGVRAGNWLAKEQANELLNAPDPRTLKGKRDRAILALLICCGLRRAELLRLEVAHIQQRKRPLGHPGLAAKREPLAHRGGAGAAKVRIEERTVAADIYAGKIFRSVNKADRVAGQAIADEKAIWQVVVHYAQATSLGKLAPHDLRRTCAKLCRKTGGELEQIQLLLG